MCIKSVLFDLDGTLLALDQDEFVKCYFKELTNKMQEYGYEPKKLMQVLMTGVVAMMKNDGTHLNEEVFWDVFVSAYGKEKLQDLSKFEAFYQHEFQNVSVMVKKKQNVENLFAILNEKNIRPILATAPLFPAIATNSRIRWAGMEPSDFYYISTYENSHSSKPSLTYYQELIDKLQLDSKDCIMIGNDAEEDMVAEKLGMQVYLVTDYLVNKHNLDIECWTHGSFEDMLSYLEKSL